MSGYTQYAGGRYHFVGAMKFYMGIVGGPAFPCGQISEAKFVPTGQELSLPDNESVGGGEADYIARITGGTVTMNWRDLRPGNLAELLKGTHSEVAAGSVTAEAVAAGLAVDGAFVPTAHLDPTSMVVSGTGGTPTYTVTTDYTVGPGGLLIPASGGTIAGDDLELAYDYGAEDVIEALNDVSREFYLYGVGANEAKGNQTLRAFFGRLRFGLGNETPLIATADFGGTQVSARVLTPDTGSTFQWRYNTAAV